MTVKGSCATWGCTCTILSTTTGAYQTPYFEVIGPYLEVIWPFEVSILGASDCAQRIGGKCAGDLLGVFGTVVVGLV